MTTKTFTTRQSLLAIAAFCALLTSGCNKTKRAESSGSAELKAATSAEAQKLPVETTKIRVGYVGLTCEASIFAAAENGFFKEEGLEPELIKCSWDNYKDTLASGGYDITQHWVIYFLKPIEQGLDVKFTGGIHKGGLRLQAAAKSEIKTIQDLRGKKIGVPGMDTPPYIFAARVLATNGIDPSKEVTWKNIPADEEELALDKGEVDAVANAEPIGSLLVASGKVRNLVDQATDSPYSDEYSCEVIVNGKFLAANPNTSAAATRALLKGAKWVEANAAAAARMSFEKKYLDSNPDLNAMAISHLSYVPGVSGAQAAILTIAQGMKAAGMLAPETDVAALAKRAFAPLGSVSDEWLRHVKVGRIAGGQVPRNRTSECLRTRFFYKIKAAVFSPHEGKGRVSEITAERDVLNQASAAGISPKIFFQNL